MSELAGHLLVATPATGGEVFHRSVVLLLHHDDDGAHGLVINKPLVVGVDAVLPTWASHLTPPSTLYQGGPVGLDTALGLVLCPDVSADPLGIHLIFRGLGVVDLDSPPEIVVPAVTGLRIFAGYSGWGPGQLDDEIAEHAWYVVPLLPEDPFSDEPGTMWTRVLARQGGRLAWAARFPEDPSLN